MTSHTLNTIGTSIGSSLFTLCLVLACTADADKYDDFSRDSAPVADSQSVGMDKHKKTHAWRFSSGQGAYK